ncbi:hypothetical protein PVAP13_8KG313700 [Panicum virgatum]|uniref:Uncharacterized protein n=1 Tax=Panicum virgatum TaxID=38727 RepID=A0A8T0PME9_PANVG|nr:hypothetical protein PVAP13_8KG313700 [Panicum virgatum]
MFEETKKFFLLNQLHQICHTTSQVSWDVYKTKPADTLRASIVPHRHLSHHPHRPPEFKRAFLAADQWLRPLPPARPRAPKSPRHVFSLDGRTCIINKGSHAPTLVG